MDTMAPKMLSIQLVKGLGTYNTLKRSYRAGEVYPVTQKEWDEVLSKYEHPVTSGPVFEVVQKKPTATARSLEESKGTGQITVEHNIPEGMSDEEAAGLTVEGDDGTIDTGLQAQGEDGDLDPEASVDGDLDADDADGTADTTDAADTAQASTEEAAAKPAAKGKAVVVRGPRNQSVKDKVLGTALPKSEPPSADDTVQV
jgi:hypothetical protein